MQEHAELIRILEQSEYRVRLSRGRGAHGMSSRRELIQRLHNGEADVDETTARLLSEMIESMMFAFEDAQADTRRAQREPWNHF